MIDSTCANIINKILYNQCRNNQTLRMQSSYYLDTPTISSIYKKFIEDINQDVFGLKIIGKGPGGYVPVTDTEKAIINGELDCAYTGLGYSIQQSEILELYTSVPFGFPGDAYISYILHGGGLDRLNQVGAKLGLYYYPMALLPPETGGWFNKEIKNTSDFKNIRMRIYGIGRSIIEMLGGKGIFLAQNDIIPAVNAGLVDAVEFSTIEIDDHLGLPSIFKYWYSPSWNQYSTILYFVINLKVWNNLSQAQRDSIHEILLANLYNKYIENNRTQYNYLIKYENKLRKFPPNVLRDMKSAFKKILDENKNLKNEYYNMKDYVDKYLTYEKIMHIDNV